ncbi:MAG: hypothetical protein CM1200mP2_53460 [Planctomycetaceae bacterium]|nr:MAG: hypothetical protein CM1200mP2_53460 [Planctomycetaceae bacterium]
MNGGPSHIDTFDPKPLLAKYEGQRPSTVDLNTQRKTTGILKSPYRFSQHGQSGLWVSELFPHVARHADKLCLIHSMHTDIPEHISGLLMMSVGANQPKTSEFRIMAQLWARNRKPGPAGFRSDQSQRSSPSRPHRMEQQFSTRCSFPGGPLLTRTNWTQSG